MPLRVTPPRQALAALILPLLASACDRAPDLAWCAADAGDAEVVVAGSPQQWTRPPQLEELWRAGGARDDESLALPVGAAVGPDGRAAVPDFQLSEVAVVGPDGRWRGAWGRRGQGPGEIGMPVAAAWGADGRLAVWDLGNSRVVFLRDGEPQPPDLAVHPAFTGAITISGEVLWTAVQADGAVLARLRAGAPGADGLQEEVIVRLSPGAAAPDTLARTRVRMVPPPHATVYAPGTTGLLAAAAPGGAVAFADRPGLYRIVVREADGRARVLCRDAAPLPERAAERGEGLPDDFADAVHALRAAPAAEIPQPLGRMFYDVDGRLWVQRERPAALVTADVLYGAAGGRYDVFAPTGAYLGEVVAPLRARLQSARGDTVWAIEVGEMDEPWLVAYRIVAE